MEPRRLKALVLPGSRRAYRWATQSLRELRRTLPADGLRAAVGPPPSLQKEAVVSVRLALRLHRATCLERSLILQRWLATNRGYRADVVIGVTTVPHFSAHAWLDGVDASSAQGEFTELMRVPPPSG